MKKIWLFPVSLLLFYMNFTLQAQNSGKEIFNSVCAACHTVNKGRLIGPDLSGIYQIRENEWLIRFIRSSQQLIKSGDSIALAIYNEYNKIPMPDNQLSDEQIQSIIEYIKASDQDVSVATAESAVPVDSMTTAGLKSKVLVDSLENQYTSEKIPEGRAFFNGYTPFTNKASPCVACHNIKDQSILGGGKLALDLTGSYSKLGPAGISAILTNPPFPVMKTSLLNNPLTADEIQALISLLKSVDERNKAYKIAQPGGMFFITIGFVCALFLLVHIYVFYDNRNIT